MIKINLINQFPLPLPEIRGKALSVSPLCKMSAWGFHAWFIIFPFIPGMFVFYHERVLNIFQTPSYTHWGDRVFVVRSSVGSSSPIHSQMLEYPGLHHFSPVCVCVCYWSLPEGCYDEQQSKGEMEVPLFQVFWGFGESLVSALPHSDS